MTYLDFLNYIHSGFTALTTTGLTDVIYIEKQLEDLIELNPNSFPVNSGKSIWICPIPMTIEDENTITYAARIYIVQQINEDFSDRMSAISECILLVNKFLQWLPDIITGIVYSIDVQPIILFDSTTEGLYFDFKSRQTVSCYI